MNKRIAVWGIGNNFWANYERIKKWNNSNSIEIALFIDKKGTPETIDGIPVIRPSEYISSGLDFDYVLVASSDWDSVLADAEEIGIKRDKLIHPRILNASTIRLDKYLKLRENPPCIVTDNCVGGVLLHYLDLPFNTPFINVRVGCDRDDFWNLLENLGLYMNRTPSKQPVNKQLRQYEWEGFEYRSEFPKLWYDNILIHGFHYHSVVEMLEKWEIRRQRYSVDNTLVLKLLFSDNDVERFKRIKHKKIGISPKCYEDKDIVTIPWDERRVDVFAYDYSSYIRSKISNYTIYDFLDIELLSRE